MKKLFTLEKIFFLEKVICAVTVTAILAVIMVPLYVKNSRNEAAQALLQQIALAEMAMQLCEGFTCPPPIYIFTDGQNETPEAAVMKLAKIGFRPDPSVAFHIMRPGVISGQVPAGFVAFTAHNSVGSAVYVYDNISARGLAEVREKAEYGGITVTSSGPALYCYKYDVATDTAEKKPNQTKYGPDPKDKYPARMIVTVAAE